MIGNFYKMSTFENLAIVILAAGKGTRMKSDKAKVLHKVAGKSMVVHVVDVAKKIANENVHVVIGHQAEKVREEITNFFSVNFAIQKELLGTGDAVKAVIPNLPANTEDVLVLYGDTPLIQESTLTELLNGYFKTHAKVTVLATDLENPKGYGRIILDSDGCMESIREDADANNEEKKIRKVNSGIYCFDKELLINALRQIKPNNKQSEYYLTDVIEIAKHDDEKITVVTMDDSRQVMGVNTLAELANAEDLIHRLSK